MIGKVKEGFLRNSGIGVFIVALFLLTPVMVDAYTVTVTVEKTI